MNVTTRFCTTTNHMAEEAAAAALARKLDFITSRADKHYSNLVAAKSPLKEDSDWHDFERLLKRQRDHYQWPEHIIPDDPTNTPNLTDTERGQLNPQDPVDYTKLCHMTNAFEFVLLCCEGHQVRFLLDKCQGKNARQAIDIVRSYFRPNTNGGRRMLSRSSAVPLWQTPTPAS